MLKIVKGIFGIDPTDMLQGLKQTNPLEGGMFPDLTPKMMIGEGGLSNLEKAGMPQGVSSADLAMARMDLEQLGQTQFERSTDWLSKGVEIDTNANKAMYEIPDDAVRVRSGRDINKVKEAGFSEIFKADLLENAYPDIADVKLKFKDEPNSNSAGGFDPVANVLTINRAHPYVKDNGLKKTVLHEVQHFVQAKEGLTYGENFALRLSEEPDYQAGKKFLDKALMSPQVGNDLVKMLTDNPKVGFNAANAQLAIKALADNPTEDALQVLSRTLGSKDMAEKFISKAGAYPALRGVLESKALAEEGYRSAFKKYTNVEGEGWANLAMNSSEMTAAQRAENTARQRMIAQGNIPGEMNPSRFQEVKGDLLKGLAYTDPTQSSIQGL